MDPWEDQARELLDAPLSRGALKRAAARLDAEPDLARAVVALARSRGVDLTPSLLAGPAKRWLRAARARESGARERRNPIVRDEAFTCAHCGRHVPPHGRTARDHCPSCLRSLHVDVVPGDRAADCGGILDPVGVDRSGSTWRLRYICRRCGAGRTNQVLTDGEPPDDWVAVTRLAAGAAEPLDRGGP